MKIFIQLFVVAVLALMLSACGWSLPIFGGPSEPPPVGTGEVRITCYQGAGGLSGLGIGSAQGSFDGVRVVQGNDTDAQVTYICNEGQQVVVD